MSLYDDIEYYGDRDEQFNFHEGKFRLNLKPITALRNVQLDFLRSCIEKTVRTEVPGDYVEVGVWRGGSCIWARNVLNELDESQRQVVLMDTFEGIPMPRHEYKDQWEYGKHHAGGAGDSDPGKQQLDTAYWDYKWDANIQDVKGNFLKFNSLDKNVKFIKGAVGNVSIETVRKTLNNISVLRIDVDAYEGTYDALRLLYPLVSPGGIIIHDDSCITESAVAIDHYLAKLEPRSYIQRPLNQWFNYEDSHIIKLK